MIRRASARPSPTPPEERARLHGIVENPVFVTLQLELADALLEPLQLRRGLELESDGRR